MKRLKIELWIMSKFESGCYEMHFEPHRSSRNIGFHIDYVSSIVSYMPMWFNFSSWDITNFVIRRIELPNVQVSNLRGEAANWKQQKTIVVLQPAIKSLFSSNDHFANKRMRGWTCMSSKAIHSSSQLWSKVWVFQERHKQICNTKWSWQLQSWK